jgi:hypothetical protein
MALSRSLSSAYADMPNRDVVALRIVLEGSHGFPAIKDRHFKVHQNHVRTLGHGQLTALLAVLSHEDLKIADPLKARLEHVEVSSLSLNKGRVDLDLQFCFRMSLAHS